MYPFRVWCFWSFIGIVLSSMCWYVDESTSSICIPYSGKSRLARACCQRLMLVVESVTPMAARRFTWRYSGRWWHHLSVTIAAISVLPAMQPGRQFWLPLASTISVRASVGFASADLQMASHSWRTYIRGFSISRYSCLFQPMTVIVSGL